MHCKYTACATWKRKNKIRVGLIFCAFNSMGPALFNCKDWPGEILDTAKCVTSEQVENCRKGNANLKELPSTAPKGHYRQKASAAKETGVSVFDILSKRAFSCVALSCVTMSQSITPFSSIFYVHEQTVLHMAC